MFKLVIPRLFLGNEWGGGGAMGGMGGVLFVSFSWGKQRVVMRDAGGSLELTQPL
jgi:hypothetical protein